MIGIGLTLPNYRGTASPANIIETAERADRLGFHSVWVADHIVIPESYVPAMGPVLYETHTTLSVVAARTTRLKLGCSVMPTPYRHPLFQAKSLATLDQYSAGRVIYGGATGYLVEEFQALGLDFSKRAAITDEYVQVLKLAWTEELITFHGQFVDCTNMICAPKPVQKPHPPIWLGGDSDGAFRRIARYADGWHGLPGGSPGARREEPTIAHFAARIQRLHQIAESEGRDPATITLSIKASCQIGPDEPRPFHGSVNKIVDSIKQMEELGLELIVLAPNLLPEETSLDVVDQIASEIMAKVQVGRPAV
jgi:probable F420-dependent oxidoreductase